ncbi:P29 [Xylella fastidiosa]|uniref:P29 n=1 Tax=Xylella fastidiosa TaxID=2371 RepID=D5LLC6_XYLFS|nr:P29 [Xylella fastidiosa]ADF29449.1 P29 [Xylella fastidiosa]ADF29479.1 P29 [Xylella fastidiosa]ADF29509.1 P29 [Xylella fastidiosa]MDS9990839.1 P29 [Xylella fastidiosa]
MRRGDLVTIAMQGDFGKPRPALVIQARPVQRARERNHSAYYQYACFRAIAAHHYSAERRKRLAEAFTGDGGQGYDGEARQGSTRLRAHRRGCTGGG